MIIRTRSYPRAALLGNPSDGYFGKTIAFPFSNFYAGVTLFESPELEIIPAEYDTNVFKSMRELSADVDLYGYYGGIRLLKAAVKRFHDFCKKNGAKIHGKNFTLRYQSGIPYRLGLAGSSAIITSCMRALMEFYGVDIPRHELAGLVLAVETEELEIAAGLQDRVVQAFESPVYMDFDKKLMETRGFGRYEPMDKKLFRQLYIAYRTDLSEGSETVHNDFRERFHFGVKEVIQAIRRWSEITEQGKKALEKGDFMKLNELINLNFDIRRKVMNIGCKNLEMVELAREAGASAKFTGSGGAIIGLYRDEKMFEHIKKNLMPHQINVLKPQIVNQ